MARATRTVLAAALAAAGIYYLDPERGGRRRARLRDRYASLNARAAQRRSGTP